MSLDAQRGCVTVRSTTPRTVAFFEARKEQHARTLEALAVHLFDAAVDALVRYEEAVGVGERDAVLEYLRGMEARIRHDGERATQRSVDQAASLGQQNAEAIRALSREQRDAAEVSQARLQNQLAEAIVSRVGERVGDAVGCVVKGAFRDAEVGSAHVVASVNAVGRDVAEHRDSLCVLKKAADDASSKLDQLALQLTATQTRQACSLKLKGQEGESRLFDLLSERLTVRDGYTVEQCHGTSHACDILVRRLGHTDVRVENKAHGKETGEKVRAKEVARFGSDLMGLRCHGIFVSQHSGIVGKGACEVELLANNKVAVFLSNCEYDVERVVDMLHLVYGLDRILAAAAGGGDGNGGEGGDRNGGGGDGGENRGDGGFRVSPEVMRRVGAHLKDFANKVATAKTHLRETLSLLSELTFDVIEKLLLSGCPSSPANVPPGMDHPPPLDAVAGNAGSAGNAGNAGNAGSNHACDVCGLMCASSQGLRRHKLAKHA